MRTKIACAGHPRPPTPLSVKRQPSCQPLRSRLDGHAIGRPVHFGPNRPGSISPAEYASPALNQYPRVDPRQRSAVMTPRHSAHNFYYEQQGGRAPGPCLTRSDRRGAPLSTLRGFGNSRQGGDPTMHPMRRSATCPHSATWRVVEVHWGSPANRLSICRIGRAHEGR